MIVRMWLQERDQLRADNVHLTKRARDLAALTLVAQHYLFWLRAMGRLMDREVRR